MRLGLTAMLLAFLCSTSNAAWWSQFGLQGYVRETPIYWKASPYTIGSQTYHFDNLLHTRENLRWYPIAALRMGVEVKTRLFLGESAQELQKLTNITTLVEPYFHFW